MVVIRSGSKRVFVMKMTYLIDFDFFKEKDNFKGLELKKKEKPRMSWYVLNILYITQE